MKSGLMSKALVAVAALGLIVSPVMAGNPGQHGKHHGKKKVGFFTRIGRAIRHAGDHVKNWVMDSHVKTKKFFTGRKPRVWVCGHYDHNGKHVKGHWRYLNTKPGQNPGQGNPGQGDNPGQGENPGQGDNPGQTNPGQGEQPPVPPTDNPPPAPPSDGDQPPAPPAEQPPAEQPPAGTPGESGDDAAPQKPQTLGGLMAELVAKSDDGLALQKQAVDLKSSNGNPSDVQGLEIDCVTLVSDRDADADRLFNVLSRDLESNKGNAGIFYGAYLRNLSAMSQADRELISDVNENLKTFVRGKIAHESKDEAYKTRLDELKNY